MGALPVDGLARHYIRPFGTEYKTLLLLPLGFHTSTPAPAQQHLNTVDPRLAISFNYSAEKQIPVKAKCVSTKDSRGEIK